MSEPELTSIEITAWFKSLGYLSHTVPSETPGYSRMVGSDQVLAYVQKLEQRVMKLAAKLADQS